MKGLRRTPYSVFISLREKNVNIVQFYDYLKSTKIKGFCIRNQFPKIKTFYYECLNNIIFDYTVYSLYLKLYRSIGMWYV